MNTTRIEDKIVTYLPTIDGYTYHQGLTDYTQTERKLIDVLTTTPLRYKDYIQQLRSLPYHSDEQKAAKSKLPCFVISGTFPMRDIKANKIKTHNNLLTIDIDKCDNPDIDLMGEMRDKLFKLPYVYSCLKSVSGEGLFLIIPIKDDTRVKSYVKQIAELFKYEYGIVIDSKCHDINRKRIISYDEDYKRYIKTDCDIEEWNTEYVEIPIDFLESSKPFVIRPPRKPQEQFGDDTLTRKTIEYLINVKRLSVDDFNVEKGFGFWINMASRLKAQPNGKELFRTLSNNTSSYKDNDKLIDSVYDKADVCTDTVDEYNRFWYGTAKRLLGSEWYKIVNRS